MSNDLNLCQFIGRLGADPEVRYMASGRAVANFRIAVGAKWKKDGEQHERTEWVKCVAWGKTGEIVGEYLRKGAQVYVSGEMQTRKWQDQQGSDRYSTEIQVRNLQMLGGKRSGGGGGGTKDKPQTSGVPNDEFDDDVPF